MTVRAFIAVDPSEAVQQAVAEWLRPLATQTQGLRWVRPEGMHLTLRFLGSVDEATLATIKLRLTQLEMPGRPIELQVSGIDFFPREESPRVIWVGLTGETDRLLMLQKQMATAVSDLPVQAEEDRVFRPHLTIARIRDARRISGLGRILQARQQADFGQFSVTAVHLYKSKLTPTGATYTKILTIPMTNPKEIPS